MHCKNCGSELEAGLNFCPECGKKIEAEVNLNKTMECAIKSE